jgi:hypothetical protein
MMREGRELSEYCNNAKTPMEMMKCQDMAMEYNAKWMNFMSFQEKSFDQDSYAEMMKESQELQAFCQAAKTFEQSMECLAKSMEF